MQRQRSVVGVQEHGRAAEPHHQWPRVYRHRRVWQSKDRVVVAVERHSEVGVVRHLVYVGPRKIKRPGGLQPEE